MYLKGLCYYVLLTQGTPSPFLSPLPNRCVRLELPARYSLNLRYTILDLSGRGVPAKGEGGAAAGVEAQKAEVPPGLFGAAGRRARPLDTSRTAPPAPPAPPVLRAIKCDAWHFPEGFRKEASENG